MPQLNIHPISNHQNKKSPEESGPISLLGLLVKGVRLVGYRQRCIW